MRRRVSSPFLVDQRHPNCARSWAPSSQVSSSRPMPRPIEADNNNYNNGVRAGAARGRMHYAWVVAAVTFLSLLSSAGIGATRAVLVLPLEREFGWDRAPISLDR